MKYLSWLINLVVIVSLLVSCSPQTKVVEVEKEVTREVQVETEVTKIVTVKETVVVEGTPQVVEKVVTATPEPVEAKEPTVLRFPITSDPEGTLEPGLTLALVSSIICENLHAGLVRFNEKTELEPYLAESYEVSDDGLTYTFKLRDDATWQNGRAIKAEDFKKGFERYLDPNIAAQVGADYLGSIVGADAIINGETKELSGVEVLDDLTLTITTVEPDANFLMRLATTSAWTVPPEAVVEGEAKWVDEPVGAGPFKFVEWRQNEVIVLEANDDFFLGRPTVDRIEYWVVPDASTMLSMYEAGELDVAPVGGADLQYVTSDPELGQEIHFWTRAQLIFFGLNMYKQEVFNNKLVRQAFSYAFDKKGVIEQIFFNAYEPAKGIVPTGIAEYNPDMQGYEYNPEKAKELLAEAGYPDGAGFPTIQVDCASNDATLCEAFSAQINENLGLNLEVNVLERGEMINGLWDHNTHDAFRWGWTADFPSAEVWTHQLLHSGLDSNFVGYNNPEFDAAVDKARTTFDEEQRIAYWQQAEEIAMDDAAMIPFAYNQWIYLVKPYVENFGFNLKGPNMFINIKIDQ